MILLNNIFLFRMLLILTGVLFSLSIHGLGPSQNQSANNQQEIKLCLTMIVKNESRIIKRCLDSVKDIVDCVSICDTGSTDNTIAIIEEYLKENNIPGKVHQHPWKNFGYNRTYSAKAAQETLKELNFSLSNTYLLFLDADMILVIHPNFDKNSLRDSSYLLTQKNTDITYYNLRLAKASMPWECVGVTHEYWACALPHNREKLTTLEIDDREDGGCKGDKLERDIRLLTQGLQDEPNNERYMFYLAQSYRGLKDYDNSIKWYQARINKGGWKEEVWYSKFMIAENYKESNEWDKALSWYLDAYQYNPARAEPLLKVANYYRVNGKNDLAYLFAKQGSKIPFPKDQLLFVSYPVYDYQFQEEISIAAYYTGLKNEGLSASDYLILKKDVPGHIKNQAYVNLKYYAEPLKDVSYKSIEIKLPKISEQCSLTYNPSNPSIRKLNDGYQVICRAVNYIQFGATTFKTLDVNDPIIRTKNFLLKYDRDFNLLSQHEIVEDLPRQKHPWRAVEGLEDCRLVDGTNDIWFTCSTDDTIPVRSVQISLCRLAKELSGNVYKVEKLVTLKGPNPNRCEKNWLPFSYDNQIHVIYSSDPFILYRPDPNTGALTLVHKYEPKYDFSTFRGSAAPIEFDDGYLMMVHEVAFKDQRYYYHRFVYLDKDFHITKVSRPFVFKNTGIEFCLGITKDHSEKNLVMSIGIEDREACIGTTSLDNVRSLLYPLSEI